MVAHNPKPAWLPDHHIRPGDGGGGAGDVVGILAFEAAATMTRLLSIHRSLTDREILRLRSDFMRSPGVSYLTSTDQPFLIRLACAELLSDLDLCVSSASRLGSRCQSPLLRDLPRVFSALINSGDADPRLVFKHPDRTLRRIQKLVSSTHTLFLEMESLSDLETAERKLAHKYIHSGPIPKPPPQTAATAAADQDLRSHRQRVRRLKEESIWGQTLEKTVTLMSRAACTAFARICVVFGPYVQGLPPVVVSNEHHSFLPFAPKSRIYPRFTSSGPLERRRAPPAAARNVNSCPIPSSRTEGLGDDKWREMLVPPPGTVGAAGMAARYAAVIVQAERMLSVRASTEGMGAEERKEEAAARDEVYEMLPAGMRAMVRGKLRDWWREEREREGMVVDGGIAEGWKEAVGRMMGWLAPVARDTLQWQAERNVDRRLRFDPKPRVMAFQTLLFADREKTEAAIAVVLVGLSLVGWYDDVRCRQASMRV